MTAIWERRRAARFLCLAAWRCEACETPWYASQTVHRARVAVVRHEKACHGG